jgi:hypothetical protein
MKDVGHAMAALLIQVQTEQLILAFRSVLLSERVVMVTLCDLLYRSRRAPRIGVQRRRRAIARKPRYLGVARRWPADLLPGRQRIEDAPLRAGQGTAARRSTGFRRCRRTRLRGGRRNGDRVVMDVHLDGDVLV